MWAWDDCVTYLNSFPDLQQRYYRDVIQIRSSRDLDEMFIETIAIAFHRRAFEASLHIETWLEFEQALQDMAYMLKCQDGFRLFLDDGCVDIDSNLVENAMRSPAMNRRNALFAGHDEGGRNWTRFASLIASCKMNGVEPYTPRVHRVGGA